MATAACPARAKHRDFAKPDVSQQHRQRLEVPRVSSLVKQLRLENPAASPAVAPPAQRPSIGAAPTSDLLGRLQQFLPAMQSANAQLATAPPAAAAGGMDIKFREDDSESSEGEDSDDSAAEPHIVMDLACGVFDLKDEAALAAATRQMSGAGGGMPMPGAAGDMSDSGSSDEDSDDESEDDVGREPRDGGAAGTAIKASASDREAMQIADQEPSGAGNAMQPCKSGKGKQMRARHRGIQEL